MLIAKSSAQAKRGVGGAVATTAFRVYVHWWDACLQEKVTINFAASLNCQAQYLQWYTKMLNQEMLFIGFHCNLCESAGFNMMHADIKVWIL